LFWVSAVEPFCEVFSFLDMKKFMEQELQNTRRGALLCCS
jgi:hypothetical protein